MNIIGSIIFLGFAVLFFVISQKNVFGDKLATYPMFPIVKATVCHTYDFHGQRWVVSFTDTQGNQQYAMDDMRAASTFSPKKYRIPKPGTQMNVYIWEHKLPNCHYSINGTPLLYYFHFCDDRYYDLLRKQAKSNQARMLACSVCCFLCAAIILLAG